jgi:hypothetical protein
MFVAAADCAFGYSALRSCKLILPDEQIMQISCPAPFEKTFPFSLDPNHFISPAVPSHAGALAIVTNAGRDAVDAAAPARK